MQNLVYLCLTPLLLPYFESSTLSLLPAVTTSSLNSVDSLTWLLKLCSAFTHWKTFWFLSSHLPQSLDSRFLLPADILAHLQLRTHLLSKCYKDQYWYPVFAHFIFSYSGHIPVCLNLKNSNLVSFCLLMAFFHNFYSINKVDYHTWLSLK